jgi:hypothetical protein
MGKKRIYSIMSGLLVTLFLTGAAGAEASAAYPVKNTPALTSNDLYDAGYMKAVKCPEGALSTSSTTAAKRTLSALWRCMNSAWEAYLKDTGLHFRTGKLLVLTKGRRFCGQKWDRGQAGTYCPESHTAAVLVNKSYLETREIFHFQLVASLYASHVQELTGIGPAFENLRYHGMVA